MIDIPRSVITGLGIIPPVLILFLKLKSTSFEQNWEDAVNAAGSVEEKMFMQDYMAYTIFSNDWFTTKNYLIFSYLYAVLFFLWKTLDEIVLQQDNVGVAFIIPLLLFLLLAYRSNDSIDRWYQENKHCANYYYGEYHDKTTDNINDDEDFPRESEPIDLPQERIQPRKLITYSEISLIVSIASAKILPIFLSWTVPVLLFFIIIYYYRYLFL